MGVGGPLSMACAVMVGRWLGPEGKGEYTLAMLVGTLFLNFLSLGIPAGISYYLGGARVPENSLVKTVVVMAGLLGFAAILIALLLDRSGWCFRVFGVHRLSRAMWIVVLGLPFQFAGMFLQFVVLAQGCRVLFAALPVVGQLLGTSLIITLAVLGKMTPFAVTVTMVACQTLVALVQLSYEQLRVRWLLAPFLPARLLKAPASFSLINYAGGIFQFLIQRVDVLMLSVFFDFRSVGIYSVAYAFSELLLLLPQRLGALYFPRVAAQPEPSEKAGELCFSSSLVFEGSVVAAACLALAAPVAIRFLYGPAFTPAVIPFFLLLPGTCALAMTSVLVAYLAGAGRVRTTTSVTLAALVCNALLNFTLIPRFGVPGAAVASSLTYLAEALLLILAVSQATGSRRLSLFTSASPSAITPILRRMLWRESPVASGSD